jgi:hypothetical protein
MSVPGDGKHRDDRGAYSCGKFHDVSPRVSMQMNRRVTRRWPIAGHRRAAALFPASLPALDDIVVPNRDILRQPGLGVLDVKLTVHEVLLAVLDLIRLVLTLFVPVLSAFHIAAGEQAKSRLEVAIAIRMGFSSSGLNWLKLQMSELKTRS